MLQLTGKSSLAASVLAAIGASVCCFAPLVLLALGIGGTWVSGLTRMEPYRPVFIGLTLLFLGLAFRQLYLVPQTCAPDTSCADPRTETMSTDACQFYYQCRNCKVLLRPKPCDCCVFCSFGSVSCTPVQQSACCS